MATPRDVQVLAGIFGVSGFVHLWRPRTYEPLMPPWVPRHREVILASGVVELLSAAGLLSPATRSTAGWVSVAVLVAVMPAHLQMLQDADRAKDKRLLLVALARLPLQLQLPMIRIALRAARG